MLWAVSPLLTPMTIDSRRFLYYFLRAVLVSWAVYTTVLTTGHFLSLLPKYRGESAWLILVGLACAVVLSDWRSAPALWDDTPRLPVAHFALLAVAFVILAFAIYAGALSFGLLSDDFVLLGWAAEHQFVIRS